jgi:VanZ family protein
MDWLRWWWPVVVWAALIFSASTDQFSGEHTSRFFIPFLHWLFPSAASDTLEAVHLLFRKSAHVGEYFLFSLLLVRGIRGARRGWRMEWALAAIALAAGWAALDELHQAFVPSRGPSMIDVLIDTSGAILGQVVFAVAVFLHARRTGRSAAVDRANPIV